MSDDCSIFRIQAKDGTELAVAHHPPTGPGPLIVLVHGIASHMGWYRPLAAKLAEVGCAVFIPDRRGSGISGGERGHMSRFDALLEDLSLVVVEAQKRYPERELHAIGLSLGAVVVTALEIRRPKTFASLILFAPGFKPAVKIPLWRRLRVLRRSFTDPTKLYDLPFGVAELTNRNSWQAALSDDPLRTTRVSARFLVQMFALQRSCWLARRRLAAPVFALLGQQDAVVNNERTLELLSDSGSPQLQIEILDPAAHLVPASLPRRTLVDKLLAWMRGERPEEARAVTRKPIGPFAEAELPDPPDLKIGRTP